MLWAILFLYLLPVPFYFMKLYQDYHDRTNSARKDKGWQIFWESLKYPKEIWRNFKEKRIAKKYIILELNAPKEESRQFFEEFMSDRRKMRSYMHKKNAQWVPVAVDRGFKIKFTPPMNKEENELAMFVGLCYKFSTNHWATIVDSFEAFTDMFGIKFHNGDIFLQYFFASAYWEKYGELPVNKLRTFAEVLEIALQASLFWKFWEEIYFRRMIHLPKSDLAFYQMHLMSAKFVSAEFYQVAEEVVEFLLNYEEKKEDELIEEEDELIEEEDELIEEEDELIEEEDEYEDELIEEEDELIEEEDELIEEEDELIEEEDEETFDDIVAY